MHLSYLRHIEPASLAAYFEEKMCFWRAWFHWKKIMQMRPLAPPARRGNCACVFCKTIVFSHKTWKPRGFICVKKKSTKLASRVDEKCLSRVRLASWPVRAEVWKRGYASTAQSASLPYRCQVNKLCDGLHHAKGPHPCIRSAADAYLTSCRESVSASGIELP